MVLYIDLVSRANSLRQLKRTMNFFKNFMSFDGNFNKKYTSNNFHSFEFLNIILFNIIQEIIIHYYFMENQERKKKLF